MNRCLVIGANGFIGSHLVDELASRGFTVRAFDRFSRPPQYIERAEVETLQGNFFDDITVGKVLKDIDYVFHSFSATTPFTADTDPYTDISSNVLRNIQLFEKCVEAGTKKVIFISSGGAIYGDVAEHKTVSESTPPNPVSPYGIGKLASEHYLGYFERKYGLSYVSYRLSNPYGPRQAAKNNQGVISTFMQAMLQSQDITVIGDGNSTRDYIFINDAVSLIAQSFEKSHQNVYNVGKGKQTSVNEILETLQSLLKTTPNIRHIDEPKTFLRHASIDTRRFEKEFGIKATTELKDGLVPTLEFYKKNN